MAGLYTCWLTGIIPMASPTDSGLVALVWMPVRGFLLGSWYCTAIGYHQMVKCMRCCVPFQLATWVALLSLYGDFPTQLCL